LGVERDITGIRYRSGSAAVRRTDLMARWLMPVLFLLVTLETLYLKVFV
jgi:hypothetical protein